MAVVEIYSKRQRRLRGDFPEIFVYDEFPDQLRTQITQIINDAIGVIRDSSNNLGHANHPLNIYREINKILCREYGVDRLTNEDYAKSSLFEFIRGSNFDGAMDATELLFQAIDGHIRRMGDNYRNHINVGVDPNAAIEELNTRFKEHGIGYQFESGEIIRVDSTFIHSEVVKPVLKLISDPIFETVNQEYLSAHEHYRHGNNEEAMVDCLKAFESCMMVICSKNKWVYPNNATAKTLIQIIFDNNLIPSYLQSEVTALRGVLESGVPVLRNKNGGHGKGVVSTEVPESLVRYSINLTGSNIIFLIESHNKYN